MVTDGCFVSRVISRDGAVLNVHVRDANDTAVRLPGDGVRFVDAAAADMVAMTFGYLRPYYR